MKIIFTTIALTAISIVTFGQDHFEKIYFSDIESETEHTSIKTNNAVGLFSEVKMSLKISNTSESFILFNPEESKFIIKGKEINISEKSKIIPPEKFKSWTINGLEEAMNKEKSFSMNLSGLYEIKENDKSMTVPELKLPLAKNSFEFGNVDVKVLDVVKESKKTSCKIKVRNNSDEYIIVHTSNVSAKMPDGNLYACESRNDKPVIIEPKSSEEMTFKWDRMPGGSANDMQLREMLIQWDDVFYSAAAQLEEGVVLEFKWDEVLTKGKN